MTAPSITIVIAASTREEADAIAKVIGDALVAADLGPGSANVRFSISF